MIAAAGATLVLAIANPAEAQDLGKQDLGKWKFIEEIDEFSDEDKSSVKYSDGKNEGNLKYIFVFDISCNGIIILIRDYEQNGYFKESESRYFAESVKFRVDKNKTITEKPSFKNIRKNGIFYNFVNLYELKDNFVGNIVKEMKEGSKMIIGFRKTIPVSLNGFANAMRQLEEKCPHSFNN